MDKNKALEGTVASKRDGFTSRLKNKYPDKDFADDEALFDQVGQDYDEYENSLNELRGSEKALTDLFNSDPRSAAFLTSWKDGKDPAVALMEMFGDEIVEAINAPAKMEEIAKAREAYLARVAEEDKNNEEYKANLAQSLQMLEQYQQERGMSDEQVDALMESVIKIVSDGVMGKFERQTLDMMMKAMSYDADLENASSEGEVRGRNAKISERLRRPSQGDGTPALNEGGAEISQPQRRRASIFEEARQAL